jgi:adenylate cyclase
MRPFRAQPYAGSVPASVPDAVRASVLDRVRLLDRRARTALLCAAVIGRRFDTAVLEAAVARSAAEIGSALEAACALQLLEREDESGTRFTFRHALTQDVLYAELLAIRTQSLHRRIARALERGGGSLEEIAYHWWAGRSRRRGPAANERAGDQAAALHSPQLALVHYERALDLAVAGSAAHRRLSRKLELSRA